MDTDSSELRRKLFCADSYSYLTEPQKLNLLKIAGHGKLAGTGKFVILPVDQDEEHGPAASFAKNPAAYSPANLVKLAVDAGCNALVLPYGAMRRIAEIASGFGLPLIMKVNFSTMTMPKEDPLPAYYEMQLKEAARLKCAAFGFTIYPGSQHEALMYEQLSRLVVRGRQLGLLAVVWAYPRGSGLPKPSDDLLDLEGKPVTKKTDIESAVDIVAYGVRTAFQLGADIVKCKPPKPIIALKHHREKNVYDDVPLATLAERVRHIVSQAAFGGTGIVIFSGGEAKSEEAVLEEIRQIAAGGASGSIVGRNSFQRPHAEGVALLQKIMDVYLAQVKTEP